MDDIRDYLTSFGIALRARNRAPRTIKTYRLAVDQFAAFADEQGYPTVLDKITRRHLEHHLADLIDRRSPATAAQRYASLRQFFRWAVEEGELDRHPMDGMRKPTVPDKPIPVLEDAQIKALIDACRGESFIDRRDTALVRTFLDTGARLHEISQLQLVDLDLEHQQFATVTKGQHVAVKYFGARTAQALDRYERARRRHTFAGTPWLWLGMKGKLTDSGIAQAIERRAGQAGIGHVHPHQFRHTLAHRWLAEGGNEGDLVRVMGWKDRQMLDRYGSSAAQGRARQAHQRMGLADRF